MGMLPSRTLATVIFWVFILLMSTSNGQQLVLMPDVQQTDGFVENNESRRIVPFHGSYPWFLCESFPDNDTSIVQECPSLSSLIIHTRASQMYLNLFNINRSGVPVPFRGSPTITAGTEHSSLSANVIVRQRRVSNRVYNITIDSNSTMAAEISVRASIRSTMRAIRIQFDRIPPRVLTVVPDLIDYDQRPHRVSFVLHFNEQVYVNNENAFCQEDLRRLSASFPADELSRRSEPCNSDLLNTLSLSEAFTFSGFTEAFPPVINVLPSGTDFYVHVTVFPQEDIPANISIMLQRNSIRDVAGNTNSEPVVANSTYDPLMDNSAIVPESLPGVEEPELEDFVGIGSSVSRWRPFSATTVGEASVVVVVTSIVLSLGASIASSFLGRDMTSGSMRMLNQAQKLYLTGRLAVVDMPNTYQNFTNQFGWSMFDTSGTSPVKEAPEIAYSRENLEHYQDYFNQMVFWIPLVFGVVVLGHLIIILLLFYYKKDIPSFFTFPRLEIMFGYVSTPIVATASAGLFQGDKDREAFVGLWMLIAFAFSFLSLNVFIIWHTFFYTPVNERRANMFIELGMQSDHDSQFLSKAYKFLTNGRRLDKPEGGTLKSILRVLRKQRASDQHLEPDPIRSAPQQSEVELTPRRSHPDDLAPRVSHQATTSTGFVPPPEVEQLGAEEIEEEEETETTTPTTTSPYTTTSTLNPHSASLQQYKNLTECCYGCWDWTLLSRILGRIQPVSSWHGTSPYGKQFLAAYGYVFEECRGPRVIREEATYSINQESGRVNRGFLVTVAEPPLLTLCSPFLKPFQIHRFHLQLFFRVIDLLKLVLLGCLVGGIGNENDSLAEIIIVLVVSSILLILMRITTPFLTRVDMAVGMFAEAADIFVFSMLLVILGNENTDSDHRFEEKIGVAMLVVQCIALAAVVLKYAVSTVSVSITCTSFIGSQRQKPQQPKLLSLLWKHHPHYLEHKYFDRWMVKALFKGLYGRSVQRKELPRSVAAQRYFNGIRDLMFRIFSLKEQHA